MCGPKYASREKIRISGASAFVTRSQPLEASRENAYVYGECTSGARHLNTPRLIANQAGTTVWRWDQGEPFGNDVPNNNPSGAGAFDFPLRFPGQYFDRETNLAHNSRRDYDPSIGRYVESDPIGLLGGINPYAYVDGKPLRYTDPSGLDNPGMGPYCAPPPDPCPPGGWEECKREVVLKCRIFWGLVCTIPLLSGRAVGAAITGLCIGSFLVICSNADTSSCDKRCPNSKPTS